MYLDTASVTSAKGISYSRVLLRRSFREDGKVKHRTLGNLSDCSPEEIEAVRLALKHKGQLAALIAQLGNPAGPAAARDEPSSDVQELVDAGVSLPTQLSVTIPKEAMKELPDRRPTRKK